MEQEITGYIITIIISFIIGAIVGFLSTLNRED